MKNKHGMIEQRNKWEDNKLRKSQKEKKHINASKTLRVQTCSTAGRHFTTFYIGTIFIIKVTQNLNRKTEWRIIRTCINKNRRKRELGDHYKRKFHQKIQAITRWKGRGFHSSAYNTNTGKQNRKKNISYIILTEKQPIWTNEIRMRKNWNYNTNI